MVMRETEGKGVDLVLNSLVEEKLLASVRCLARGGRFLEIGKFDMSSNNSLNLLLFEKKCSFHGVMLDHLIDSHPKEIRPVCNYIKEFIDKRIIKPLNRCVFKPDDIEKAFRLMAAGKHTGKILIEVRKEGNEEVSVLQPEKMNVMPRYYCSSDKSYIIIGGLGDFGLELADWLILRGAQRLILTSRSGIKNGYQQWRMRIWKSYGVSVNISLADITTEEGCLQLIHEATAMGPLEGIFNLALVFKDGIFENQTIENFRKTFGPKALATRYLDQITRIHCPNLQDFVVFSSVACGKGNGSQTNYGMANSVMERICEKRRENGFPAIAIQWGTILEVGMADIQEKGGRINVLGTLPQRMFSCLQVLDNFLRQEQAIIVSSKLVATKMVELDSDTTVSRVANVLGISDFKSVSLMSTLPELGMDSMIMERICEKRRENGFPTIANQCGTILEVGMYADIQEKGGQINVLGTLPQRMSNCLQVLDNSLREEQAIIVSSKVVATKRVKLDSDTIVNCVANVLGISDLKSVSLMSTLPELGMDSMTAFEIKHVLQREYEVPLTANELRSLSLARLQEISDQKLACAKKTTVKADNLYKTHIAFDLIPKEDEYTSGLVRLKTNIDENTVAPTVLFVPGFEGFSKAFETQAGLLNCHAVCLQYDIDKPTNSVLDMAKSLLIQAEGILNGDKTFVVVAHSFGVTVALELVAMLEEKGMIGTLFCLDGSPTILKMLYHLVLTKDKDTFETNFVCMLLSHLLNEHFTEEHRRTISQCRNLDEKLNLGLRISGDPGLSYSLEYQKKLCLCFYERFESAKYCDPSFSSITSRVKLCKPSQKFLQFETEDYDLTQICKRVVEIQTYEGDHRTIITNAELAKEISECVANIA